MKRYCLVRQGDGKNGFSSDCKARIDEHKDGPYVKYEDAKAAVDLVKRIRQMVDNIHGGTSDRKVVETLYEILHSSNIGCIGCD